MYIEYLTAIVAPLVLNPDAIKIQMKDDEMGTLLILSLQQEDMGRIIGKEGATAKAVRHLMRNLGMRNNKKVSVQILEPDGNKKPAPRQN